MKKENWVWMPHPGHFIASNSCRFHLNTYVGGYIVSTVGEYFPDSRIRERYARSRGKTILGRGDEWDYNYFKEFGFEEIGCDRKYETMVFKAVKDTMNLCCPWKQQSGSSLDFEGYNDPGEALQGHMRLCRKWGEKK